jgi:hypothetical protein
VCGEHGEEDEMSRGAEESGECWDFGYQRCMRCDPFRQIDVCGRWGCGDQGVDGSEKSREEKGMSR